MLFIAENLKALRKGKNLTQEEAAEMLGVSPQSVSKWERGETLPDITLLPALANLYKTGVDALLGMEKINDRQAISDIFSAGHEHIRAGNSAAAVDVYTNALKTFPGDEGIMSDLAMALALANDPEKLLQAVSLCERVLSQNQGGGVHHTTRAALCFIYMKAGESEKAIAAARMLPHMRESREMVLLQLDKLASADDIDAYIKFLAIGEQDEQDSVEIDFGVGMVAVCTEHGLLDSIKELREQMKARGVDAHRMPKIRVRDKSELAPNQVRVRRYADFLLDRQFESARDAADEIMETLRKTVCE